MQPTIHTEQLLTQHNSFAVPATAAYFTTINSVAELQNLISAPVWQANRRLVMGEGTNTLFVDDFSGLVVLNQIRGVTKLREDDNCVWLQVGAGENWHQFVEYCLENDYAGVENLSLIPGSMGAAPIQNIGAYGVELSEVFEELQAVSVTDAQVRDFRIADCEFAYRDSVFKNDLLGEYVITHVTLRLNKRPTYNISYGQIAATLDELGIKDISIRAISEAVCHIRRCKLPDPNVIPNAGSFFKNPFVTWDQLQQITAIHDDVPHYEHDDTYLKIPAAWLIERCGWKGKSLGAAGVHENQALVLVNRGGATGGQLFDLSKQIQEDVKQRFDVLLQPEVTIVA